MAQVGLIRNQEVAVSESFRLVSGPHGLALHKSGEGGGVMLERDELTRRLRQGKRLLLARACGVGAGISILDAMAGFGLDGLTLARLGGVVTMCERHPAVFALLEDGMTRLAPKLLADERIVLCSADAADVLAAGSAYDVVYLDPMFPSRAKRALPGKRARYLAELVGAGAKDVEELLAAARRAARLRVVLKRRRRDPVIDTPHHHLEGRAVRFDVYRPSA